MDDLFIFLINIFVTLLTVSIALWLKGFLPQKGKNLADKNDMKEITEKIESVKSEFTKQHEDVKSFYTSKHIAAEKRLDKHQEAYTLSIKLLHTVYDKECRETVIKAQSWLYQNALYLTPKSREAFNKCVVAASGHSSLLAHSDRGEKSITMIKNNFSKITEATEIIAKEADLPSFSDSYNIKLDNEISEQKIE